MADDVRHDQPGTPDERRAHDKEQYEQYEQSEQDDELGRRREHSSDRPALTRREREERWPVG